MTEAEKAYQYFVIAVPENEEQAKAYFWARKALQSTLTQPNELLTLEELREMDGDPVWIDDEKTWALLQVWDGDNIDAVFPMPRGCFHAENVIGKKIFRRPPEGEANA